MFKPEKPSISHHKSSAIFEKLNYFYFLLLNIKGTIANKENQGDHKNVLQNVSKTHKVHEK